MVLEATVLVIDNSEWSRNGDYMPTRFQAQIDSVRYLFGVKTNDNPENLVGVIASAGVTPQVLVSLTGDQGVLLKGMHGLGIRGTANFDTGIQIAQLVLKHRANKNQKTRVIAFAGSPIATDEKSLVRLGKKLKKNNVAVDVVSFGENAANEQKLNAFIEAVNNNDTSHLVVVPPGPHVLSEQIRASAIVGGGGGPGGADNGDFEFGVDPDLDPELAMALRMSMRDEEERQMREAGNQPGAGQAAGAGGAAGDGADAMMDMDDDEDIRRAIQMSLEESGQGSGGAGSAADAENSDLVASLVGSLPGVDANDPELQSALGTSSSSHPDRDADADADAGDQSKNKPKRK